MTRHHSLVACLLLLSAAAFAEETTTRNILWDGGFNTGYGNAFWATTAGGKGPSRRDLWNDGVLSLKQPVCSRVYWLNEGSYAICAWVKRSAEAGDNPQVTLEVTNVNNPEEKNKNVFSKKLLVPAGEGWHAVGFTFDIKAPFRPQFHVEVSPVGKGILLDAVSLTQGTAAPSQLPPPASDVEATFFIPEETGIYVDGEERVVELVIRNHGPQRSAKVRWEIYNHLETKVREGVFDETLPAGTTVRKRMPLADLPYDGYRLACSVEGQKVLGDGLVALLPKIDADSGIRWGGDANINPPCKDFMPRWMNKMGMKRASTLSPGQIISRWSEVEKVKGKYVWQDKTVDAACKQGIELVAVMGLKFPPPWLREAARKEGRDMVIYDLDAYTEAYCRYIDAFVRHYAGRINVFMLEDEVHTMFNTAKTLPQLVHVYNAAYDTAKKAAKDMGVDIRIGINGSIPAWWERFILAMGGMQKIDLVSQNTAILPQWAADTLNMLRKNNWYPSDFCTLGVGQRSELRKTSLLAESSGAPMGLFAWELMEHMWLSRPYGDENVKHGPIITFGYYDVRVLGQYIACPCCGLTIVEYDNSPTLGGQAMAMLKYHLGGMRPVRDASKEFSLDGAATRHAVLRAYPFRDDRKAVIVLTTKDGTAQRATWKFSGDDFVALKPFNIYGQPVKIENGAAVTVELPVFVAVPAERLDQALKTCAAMAIEEVKPSDAHHVEAGKYFLDVDPDSPNLLRIGAKTDTKDIILIDKVLSTEKFSRPNVNVSSNRLNSTVNIVFEKGRILSIALSENGVNIRWHCRNLTGKPVENTFRLRVSLDAAGKEITLQEGDKTIRGHLREDFGVIQHRSEEVTPALPDNASRVTIDQFATFELPQPAGKGFSPQSGFLFRQPGGEAMLQAAYTVEAADTTAGSRGAKFININMTITVP